MTAAEGVSKNLRQILLRLSQGDVEAAIFSMELLTKYRLAEIMTPEYPLGLMGANAAADIVRMLNDVRERLQQRRPKVHQVKLLVQIALEHWEANVKPAVPGDGAEK